VNVVLNGAPPACCCGEPKPIHSGCIEQRTGLRAASVFDARDAVEEPRQRVAFNTWAPPEGSGFPPQLAGRVEPAVWAKFVHALSSLAVEQPSCLEAVFCCKCCTAGAEFRSTLTQFETFFGPRLGASFSDRVYTYQMWVESDTAGAAHWENRQIYYVRVDFATPMPNFMAGVPMMQQPMMQQPMLMQQPGVMIQQNPMMQMQQPGQLYAQQPGMMMQPGQQYAQQPNQMQPQGGPYYAPQ